MKTLAVRTFQLQQITTNGVLLIACCLPFLFTALLLDDYLSKFFNIPFLSLIVMLPFFIMYSYVITADVELTLDQFGLKFNVTKSALLISKGETAFVWSSLKSFSKKEGKRAKTYLLLRWEGGGRSHRLSGEDNLVLYEYLKYHFPEKETTSSWLFM